MGKALVIKNVSFAANALATVSFENKLGGELSYVYILEKYNHKADATDQDYVYTESGSAAYAAIHSDVETPKRLRYPNANLYPILLPSGARTVKIAAPSTVRVTAWFCDSKTACDYSKTQSGYDMYAKLISGDASAFDASVALGDRTLTVPDGADSVAFSVQYPNGTVTDDVMAQIKIEAS